VLYCLPILKYCQSRFLSHFYHLSINSHSVTIIEHLAIIGQISNIDQTDDRNSVQPGPPNSFYEILFGQRPYSSFLTITNTTATTSNYTFQDRGSLYISNTPA